MAGYSEPDDSCGEILWITRRPLLENLAFGNLPGYLSIVFGGQPHVMKDRLVAIAGCDPGLLFP